jgi:hypothetical protein
MLQLSLTRLWFEYCALNKVFSSSRTQLPVPTRSAAADDLRGGYSLSPEKGVEMQSIARCSVRCNPHLDEHRAGIWDPGSSFEGSVT